MSYNHNVYVGNYAIVTIPKGKAPDLHWKLNLLCEEGNADDKCTAAGCHVIFPEFLSHDVLYIMLDGHVRVSDVSRNDSSVNRVETSGLTSGFINSYSELFRRLFKATEVKFDFGVVVEVV